MKRVREHPHISKLRRAQRKRIRLEMKQAKKKEPALKVCGHCGWVGQRMGSHLNKERCRVRQNRLFMASIDQYPLWSGLELHLRAAGFSIYPVVDMLPAGDDPLKQESIQNALRPGVLLKGWAWYSSINQHSGARMAVYGPSWLFLLQQAFRLRQSVDDIIRTRPKDLGAKFDSVQFVKLATLGRQNAEVASAVRALFAAIPNTIALPTMEGHDWEEAESLVELAPSRLNAISSVVEALCDLAHTAHSAH